ncbi:MAG TPA: DegT/DnrJ/EryC1/StrS family aminotransferase [Nitrobacter sp.]|nr:DegT/DnrJ/EryC1/StrS family aminotransferase [Nitrobacter sp.]
MIPFIDLKSQYERIRGEVEQSVIDVLRGGQYVMGKPVEEVEHVLAARAGVRHAVSCASGTDALVIAMMAEGFGPGDVIFCPPFTFMATAEAIALVGATPVFIDIDERSFNLDPRLLQDALDRLDNALKPKAIIAVDLFGLPADYGPIQEFADVHGLLVIEDAAQSFGAQLDGKPAGSLAPVACTSFFPAKPLGCFGDGGAIFTDDDGRADLYRSIRVHGQGEDRYEHVRIGLTGRLDTIQAAVLLEKLKIFDDELDRRQHIAMAYSDGINQAGLDLVTPWVAEGVRSAWAQYSVLAPNSAERQKYRDRLQAAEVPTTIYYPIPLHLQPAFASLGYREGDFRVSESVAGRIFSLPMHPYLEDDTVHQIIKAMAA